MRVREEKDREDKVGVKVEWKTRRMEDKRVEVKIKNIYNQAIKNNTLLCKLVV